MPFPPEVVHAPGVAHGAADQLSRIYAPGVSVGSNKRIHPALMNARVITPAVRDERFYRIGNHCSAPSEACERDAIVHVNEQLFIVLNLCSAAILQTANLLVKKCGAILCIPLAPLSMSSAH